MTEVLIGCAPALKAKAPAMPHINETKCYGGR
jgi:hypothetical protein